MSDLILDVLFEIEENLKIVGDRFSKIKTPEDFVSSEAGKILLDAIGIRLMSIGESLSKIQKLDSQLLKKYPQVEWDDVVRFRNFIAHHYELLDYQIVFSICKSDIPILSLTIDKIIQDLSEPK